MTVFTTDMAKQVASLCAESDAERDHINAERLDAWKRRYPYNTVEIPETRNPPKWPASRASLSPVPPRIALMRGRAA